jgi:hypothetical protein
MTLTVSGHGRAECGPVALWITPHGDGFDRYQLALAQRIAAELPELHRMAATYLDRFVDRARICGRPDEWWLDEVDLRRASEAHPVVTFGLGLDGDHHGLWTVELRLVHDGLWPVRLQRLQQ